jgi:hypothetical protein
MPPAPADAPPAAPPAPCRNQSQVTAERRHWKRFGTAAKETPDEQITMQATEDIPFDRIRPTKATAQEKKVDLQMALAGADKHAVVGSLKDVLYKKRMERELLRAKGLLAAAEKPPEEGDGKPSSMGAAPKAGRCVRRPALLAPCAARARAAGPAGCGSAAAACAGDGRPVTGPLPGRRSGRGFDRQAR